MIGEGRVEAVVRAIAARGSGLQRPVMVAVDGRSGAGKSTFAHVLSSETGAAVVEGDTFYAGGTADAWDSMTAAARVAHCMDWRRQRPVLLALAAGRSASWLSYDWVADDGRLEREPTTCRPSAVVVLEGVYSARPELADLFDLRVLVEVPGSTRWDRLEAREHFRPAWEQRWAIAEDHYFTAVMPPPAFDLHVDATAP